MGKILIEEIRVDGFRGLKNFRTSLSETTVLTGMNNVGKTSVLKALQLCFGSYSFLTTEDFYIEGNKRSSKITIDVLIVPVDDDGKRIGEFDEDWAIVLKADSIERNADGYAYFAFRTTFSNNAAQGAIIKDTRKLIAWEQNDVEWTSLKAEKKCAVPVDQMPFFYIDAQRDILDDVKSRNSFIGRMLSQVADNYSKEQTEEIERLIAELNKQAIDNSDVLTGIQNALSGLDSAMDKVDSTVKVLPFAKKLRDLNKGLSIQYGTAEDSFTMDYHGMGTRSWSSLLTFKAFLNLQTKLVEDGNVFCPIIAIEEPESHLHPNAQKQLFGQISEMSGIKIISTHSPYVASCSRLTDIRGLYKVGNSVTSGHLNIEDLNADDIRNVERQVINSHGELLFSKAIVLFEGETESQALPIFAEDYFGKPASALGINFVGVGGYGFYAPYIRFAEAYNIPWFIFSDGEKDAIDGVKNAVQKAKSDKVLDINTLSNVFIISGGNDYEGYITSLNYIQDFRDAWKNGITEIDPRAIAAREKKIDGYDALYFCKEARDHKTRYASPMAFAIVNSKEGLPPLVNQLFEKVKSTLTNV